MKASIDVDLRDWKQAAGQLYLLSSRTLPDFINGQAMGVASKAIEFTEKADPLRIARTLGEVAREVRLKTAKNRKGSPWKQGKRILKEDSFAERILAKRFQETGKWGVKGKTLKDRAANLIAARSSAVAFIKSGWIPAVKKLAAIVKRKPRGVTGSSRGVKKRGVDKGRVTLARPGWRVACEIVTPPQATGARLATGVIVPVLPTEGSISSTWVVASCAANL